MVIVITLPYFFKGEADRIASFLQMGKADLIHLRKPHCRCEDLQLLIESIPESLYNKLVLHDHHFLASKYGLYGIHLNSRNPEPFDGWQGSVSRSCHSLEELEVCKESCDYVSLSPIFDSISKQGYTSAFSAGTIADAVDKGIIDQKVMALGGVTFARLQEVYNMGFGGGMILGDAWK